LAFGLAFYMLLNNEVWFRLTTHTYCVAIAACAQDSFGTGGLSLMNVIVMSVGALDYEAVLVPREENLNSTSFINQLKLNYNHYSFVNSSAIDVSCFTANSTCPDSKENDLRFPALSYGIFIIFMMLMPIVVLNLLVIIAIHY
jgi:hypothetical protein